MARVNPLGRHASKTPMQRWFIKEAYPLYITLGLGCAACAFHLTRLTFFGPDVHFDKKGRSSGMPDELTSEQRGEHFHNHVIRRVLHGHSTGILPDFAWTNDEQSESKH